MAEFPVITIDGPVASGKSSVSRALAGELGWNWVSTGAFYRGLAYVADQEGVDLSDGPALAALAASSIWSVEMTPDQTRVFLRNEDVTEEVFKERVGSLASLVSQYPEVREALLGVQRQCALKSPGLVAEGRDCGTVVFPGARLKFFLTASQEDRALRRAQEFGGSLEDTRIQQRERDARDKARKTAPLIIADGAEVVDTSGLSLAQVVEKVLSVVHSNGPL